VSYLHRLTESTPGAANVRRYAEIVRERSVQRAIIAAATEILEDAYQAAPAGDLVDRAQAAIVGLTARGTEREPRSMKAVLGRVMENIDDRQGGRDRRIATGLADLDRMLHGGLRPGRLYVLAGRPSSGKSALALQIAVHAALTKHPAMVASLEMADDENGERALAAAAKVDLDRIITGDLAAEQWDRMGVAVGELGEAPIYFDDTPALTLQRLRARVRRMAVQHRIELLVVDYLQLMRTDARGENRNQEVGELAEGLKALAKELGLAVIALSQMNRKCEDRPNKRGMVADLRDSGGIDAAADLIAFVYRDEMYDEATPAKGIAEIIVRKARHARTGTVYAVFRGELARFEDAAPGYVPVYGSVAKSKALPAPRRSFHDTERD
jgi:replicative DNA helicase